MRYALVVDGVPIGHVELKSALRATGTLVPLPAFVATRLRDTARLFGAGLVKLGDEERGSLATARALVLAAAEEIAWQSRLSLVDGRGATAATGPITVVEFPDGEIIIVADLSALGMAAGVPSRRGAAHGGESSRPAA